MVIVDTSVWINHFHKNDLKLEMLLYDADHNASICNWRTGVW